MTCLHEKTVSASEEEVAGDVWLGGTMAVANALGLLELQGKRVCLYTRPVNNNLVNVFPKPLLTID